MDILIFICKDISYRIKEYLMALILMILTNFLISFTLSFWDPLLMSELHTMTLSCNMTNRFSNVLVKLLDFQFPMKLPIVYLFLWSPLVTTILLWHVV